MTNIAGSSSLALIVLLMYIISIHVAMYSSALHSIKFLTIAQIAIYELLPFSIFVRFFLPQS